LLFAFQTEGFEEAEEPRGKWDDSWKITRKNGKK